MSKSKNVRMKVDNRFDEQLLGLRENLDALARDIAKRHTMIVCTFTPQQHRELVFRTRSLIANCKAGLAKKRVKVLEARALTDLLAEHESMLAALGAGRKALLAPRVWEGADYLAIDGATGDRLDRLGGIIGIYRKDQEGDFAFRGRIRARANAA